MPNLSQIQMINVIIMEDNRFSDLLTLPMILKRSLVPAFGTKKLILKVEGFNSTEMESTGTDCSPA